MIGKIKWVLLGICFWVLKKILRYRLKGDSAKWLQPIPSQNVKIFNREDFILEYCKEKKVLHIGFSDFPFTKEKIKDGLLLHTKIKQCASQIIGVDNDAASIKEYTLITGDKDVMHCNILEDYPKAISDTKFDLIILSEVLEHLQNPYLAIEKLITNFNEGIKILVTVPNYTSLDSFSACLNKTESIHPHHYWYFSPFTLQRLFNPNQFNCEQIHFGMYYNNGVKINPILKNNPYTGDCIMAVFTIKNQRLNE